MIESVNSPADLENLSYEELDASRPRSASSSSKRSSATGATSVPTSAWWSSPWHCTGSSAPPRTSSSGTPGTRRTSQAPHRPASRLHRAAPGGASPATPAGGVRARLDREQPRLDDPLLRPWPGRGPGVRAGGGPADRGGDRRRLDDRGMAFEGLNNLGHSGKKAIIILNDNGRSYAPTVSRLGESLARLRVNPTYLRQQARIERLLRDMPPSVTAWSERWTPPRRPCGSCGSRRRSSSSSASATRAPSTATTSRALSRRCGMPPSSTTDRSWSTCSPTRARAICPPSRTPSSTCTTWAA